MNRILLITIIISGKISIAKSQVPTIANFSPSSGSVGTTVTITGSGFNTTAINNLVYFGAVKATVSAATATSIAVTVPSGASYEPISVTNNNLTGFSSGIFDVRFSTGIDFTTTSFSPGVSYASTTNPRSSTITDLDGDGKPDVLALNAANNRLSIFKNTSTTGTIVLNASQNFYTGTGTAGATGVSTADFDGDGKKDIAININNQIFANQDSLVVFRNTSTPGTISLAPRVKFSVPPVGYGGMVIGDINGDGKPDIILATASLGTISIYKNTSTPGNISFAPRVEIPVSSSNMLVAVGDLDSDGKIDLAVSQYSLNSVAVFRNTSTVANISFAAKQNFPVGTDVWGIAIADLNADSKPEIISSGTAALIVLKNITTSSTISFSAVVSFPAQGSGSGNVVVSDIDGDGKPDLAAQSGYPSFTLLRNTGTGGNLSFNPKVDFTGGLESTSLSVADLDGDALPDIVTANGSNNNISVYRNKITDPVLTSFSPASAKSGATVTLTGTNLSAVTNVSFGGIPAASFTVMSSTSITATVGAGATGIVSITGQGVTSSVTGFTFIPPPTISSFNPASAALSGTVNITGTNFTGATAVSFGGTPASSFTVVSSTNITAIVGAGSSGNVVVTTPIAAAISPTSFTFIPAPVISSFTPTSAAAATVVTISGSNFSGATEVKFGLQQAVSFTVVNPTTITATVGAGSSGNISVRTPGGTSTLGGFTFYAAPYISSFAPASGNTGTTINIVGFNFTNVTGVKFGAVNASSYIVNSATSISAIVGAGGSGIVSVSTLGGVASGLAFTYLPPPVISSISPISAGTDSTVTITGTNLSNISNVKFGGVNALSYTSLNSTTATAKVGSGASGAVSLTTLNGTTSFPGFIYLPSPVINSFSPATALSGTTVTISGNNLAGTSQVSFGNIPAASFTVVNNNTVTAVVGTGASGAIKIITNGGTTSLNGFNFLLPPALSFFSPTSAGQGTTVTLTGNFFNNASAVSFGSVPASSFVVNGPGSITAVVGPGASGNVSITTPGGVTTKTGFTFIPPPVITNFSPVAAATGQTITITGTNFTGTSQVRFGGINVSSFTVVNATTIIAIVGAGASGDVSIVTPGGISLLSGFTWYAPPSINSFSPNIGSGGTTVTITGNNFTGTTAVTFGGTAASSFTVTSATSISAVVGSGSSGAIVINSPGGTAQLAGFNYSQLPSPVISSFTPASSGPGLPVIITGTNIGNASNVSFGGIAAASFFANSANSVTAFVGTGSSGNVSITTASGSANLGGFTFIPGPTISSFSPMTAAAGAIITINGTNLTGINSVKFGAALAADFTVVNATTVTAVVGNGASGDLKVVSENGIASRAGFNFISAPKITSLSPAVISQGDEITINGTNFTNASSVTLGGMNAASYTVVSPTLIKAIAGLGSSGNVKITTPGGTAVGSGVFYSRIICPGTNTVFISDITGSNYQWQVNNGSGFNNVSNNIYYSGANSSSLQLSNAPSSFYGYHYRCLVNGQYSKTIIIRFATTWTGAISSLWENSGNWNCNTLPDSSTDVKINSGTVALNNDISIRSLQLKTGVNLTIQPGKKLKITGKGKSIEKVALGPADILLYANTPGLIMLQGEQAVLTIRQLTANIEDSIPTGLTYASSNASIATFGSDGKVTALQTGICKVTATNAQGKKMTCQVAVIASGSPLLNEPTFVSFPAPLLFVNKDRLGKINAWAVNRLGQKLPDPVTMILKNSNQQMQFAANSIINTDEGLYTLNALSYGKELIGGGTAVVFQNSNSTVLGEFSPALLARPLNNPPPGIYSVEVEWGNYPMFFTKAGVTSSAVNALVYRMVSYEIFSAGNPTGTYGITISTSEEDVNVESQNNSVIRAIGNTIQSVAPGIGLWRVVHDNYIGPWYTAQVFMDYSGDWVCNNDNFGSKIQMRIPAINPQVIYGGTKGNSLNIYEQYRMNSRSVARAQLNVGIGQKIDNSSGSCSPVFDVEIGPFRDCLFCNDATVPLRSGGGGGFLTLINQNRYGDIKYVNPDKFFLSEIGNNGRDIMFVRQTFNFCPIISSFSPTAAGPGSTVTIIGNNFTGTTAVSFGGVPATSFVVVNNTTITAVVGQGNSGVVSVLGPSGQATLGTFLIILPPPTISSFTPTSAGPGSTVTISGNNFLGTTAVGFGGLAAYSYVVVNNTTITAVIPSGALSGNVSVKTPYGEAIINGFTALPPVRGTTVVNGISYSLSRLVVIGEHWGIFADTLNASGQPNYSGSIGLYPSFDTPRPLLRPVVGTYTINNNPGSVQLSYRVTEADYVLKSYFSQTEGTITISRVDTRCVGTINNVKVYRYINLTNSYEVITLNGSFDVPVL